MYLLKWERELQVPLRWTAVTGEIWVGQRKSRAADGSRRDGDRRFPVDQRGLEGWRGAVERRPPVQTPTQTSRGRGRRCLLRWRGAAEGPR